MKVQWIAHNGKGRGSSIITHWTRGQWSHNSLRFRDIPTDLIHLMFSRWGYEFTRDHEIESIQGKGVHHRAFVESENQGWFDFQHTEEQAREILLFAASKIGCKYDWSGIGGFLTRRDRHDPNKWFCTELASDALLDAGVRLLWLPGYKQTPTVATASPVLWLDPKSPIKPAGRI